MSTKYSRSNIEQFKCAYPVHEKDIKLFLHTDRLAACIAGSTALGLATEKSDRIASSDLDIIFLYREKTEDPIPYSNPALRSRLKTTDEKIDSITAIIKKDIADPQVILLSIEEAKEKLEELMIRAQAGYSLSCQTVRYPLCKILSTLICPFVSSEKDREFMMNYRKDILGYLQNSGDPGKKIWGKMDEIFKREYVYYDEPSDKDDPLERRKKGKRPMRYIRAVNEIVADRPGLYEKINNDSGQGMDRVIIFLKTKRKNISLPPLSEALEAVAER